MTSLLQVRRTYVGLTALHWIAIGTMAPVLVLTLQARGLSLTVIGVLFTVHSVLIGALELPTGGLADTHGRRRVLLWSSVLMTGAMLLVGAVQGRLPNDAPIYDPSWLTERFTAMPVTVADWASRPEKRQCF